MRARDVFRYGRDVAMLTDLVRCTVLAEDLEQVRSHCGREASTPYLATPCPLQQILDKMRSTPCTLGLRD